MNGEYRTNNQQEAWHRGLQGKIQDAKQSPRDFVEKLQEDCMDQIQKFYSANAGNTDPPKKRSAQKIRDEKLKDLVKDFETKTPIDYLDSIAPYMKKS